MIMHLFAWLHCFPINSCISFTVLARVVVGVRLKLTVSLHNNYWLLVLKFTLIKMCSVFLLNGKHSNKNMLSDSTNVCMLVTKLLQKMDIYWFFISQQYMGRKVVRGIQCDMWQSCLYWPQLKSNFTLEYYFTGIVFSWCYILKSATRKYNKCIERHLGFWRIPE